MVGFSYSLRCVVFHNISAKQSPLTAGISVNTTPQTFERALKYLTAHYRPVSLQDVLTDGDGHGLPSRPLLVTFDDAYASVAEYAAPLCKRYGVPAVFFVNAAFLDNQRLAPDNLVCYVANVLGIAAINTALRAALGNDAAEVGSLSEVFGVLFPSLSLAQREAFLESLREVAGVNEERIAKGSGLYLTREQLCGLAAFGFEIGNHTYTHTHGRSLSQHDFVSEIDRNKKELETLSGTAVRSFSQPYGSSKDLSDELRGHLRRTGHCAVFLSESVANPPKPDLLCLDRISSRAESENRLFVEVEVLPRLRAIRNRYFRNASRS
jgi:peptidoglycan/xylan/chitin deacetylase (PgdA/CDA1 family)